MTGVYSILIVLPFALGFIRIFLIKKDNLITNIPLHLLASMIYGFSHAMLMFFSGTFIFWFGNWDAYDYGKLIYKIPMEHTH